MTTFFERRALLETCAEFMADSSSYMIIKGTAGQGKTTLVRQFIEQNSYKAINYTCSDFDSSETIFISEATRSIISQLPFENVYQYLSLHSTCKVPGDYIQTLKQAIIHSSPAERTRVIVIDDIHKVIQENKSYELVQQLLEAIRPLGKMFIIGRDCCGHFYSTFSPDVKIINHDALNLSTEETLNFYTQFLKKKISTQQLNAIFNATEGWISGLLLLQQNTQPETTITAQSSDILYEYFHDLCLKGTNKEELEEVLALSFLESIPIELLKAPEFSNAYTFLSRLEERKLFVSENTYGYTIHYLFQIVLQQTANKYLPRAVIIEKAKIISDILLQHNILAVAVELLGKFSLWDAIEEALEKNCDKVIIEQDAIHTGKVLSTCPEKTLNDYPWLLLTYGTYAIATGNLSGLTQLKRAHEVFENSKHEKGQLYSCVSLITAYYGVVFNMKGLEIYTRKGHALLHKLHDDLNFQTLLHVITSIMTGLAYSATSFKQKSNLLDLLPADPLHPSNTQLYSKAIFAHAYYLGKGFAAKGLKEYGSAYLIQTFPNTTPFRGFFLQLLAMNIFIMIGDHRSYCRIREYVQRTSPSAVFLEAKDFIAVWNQDVLLGKNAIKAIIKYPTDNLRTKHIVAQLLQFKFVAYALQGNKEKAYEYEKKALAMRARVGGGYFIFHMHSFLAVSRTLLGDYKAAQRLITVGLKRTAKRELFMITNTFYFAQAIMQLRQHNTEELKNTLEHLFHSMVMLDTPFFFGRNGEMFVELCCHAVKHNIFRQYAKSISSEQFFIAITDDGKSYDMLNFHTIGALKLRSNKIELDESAFTPLQIDILRALLAAPKNMLSVEALIESIWPNSHWDTARTKFDVTISRLRSLLSKYFGKGTGKEYLKVKNGKLLLQHATESFSRISVRLNKGLTALNNKAYWSADQAFLEAIEEIPEHEEIRQYFSVAEETVFLTAIDKWVALMKRALLHDNIEIVLKKALIMCPYVDRLYGILWRNLIDAHKYAEAAKIRQQYREILHENSIPNSVIKENETHIFSIG